MRARLLSLLLVLWLAAGCSGDDSSSPAEPPSEQRTVPTGGGGLAMTCAGDGAPTVVLDAGLDTSGDTFAALADPTRRSILSRLAEGEATVNELAEPFSVSLPAISRHLKVLERAGLIVRSREAQWRPSRM